MMGLNTAFKKVYGELLEPYGFKKIKGRNPYFVRMVGDEIVHVITCIPRQGIMRGEKFFDVLAGVATVYRGRINLDESVSSNMNWMNTLLEIYLRSHFFKGCKNMSKKWYMFPYDGNDDESLISSLKYTAELVKYVILPNLDRVYNLEACYDFFVNYGIMTHLCENEFEIQRTYEDYEGIATTMIFDEKQYEHIREKQCEKWKKDTLKIVKNMQICYSEEDYKRDVIMCYEDKEKDVRRFKMMVSDFEKMERLRQMRKSKNLGILKNLGLEVDSYNLERLSSMKHPDKIIIPDELL